MPALKAVPRPDGLMRKRCEKVRLCPSCGSIINKYHHPEAIKPLCYTCEDKLPWTYSYIIDT